MPQSELKLIVQPPPVLKATVTPPAEFKTTIENKTLNLILQQPPIIQTVVAPPIEIKSTLVVGQGPAGPPGIGEEVKYSKRVDFVDPGIIYKGEAAPGSTEDAQSWRIKKITFVGEDIKEEWAEGTIDFNKIWSSRTSYIYS